MELKLPIISLFAKRILSLPHSDVTIEEDFSILTWILKNRYVIQIESCEACLCFSIDKYILDYLLNRNLVKI